MALTEELKEIKEKLSGLDEEALKEFLSALKVNVDKSDTEDYEKQIRKLKDEAAKYRIELKTYKEEQERKALEEQGRFKELYEKQIEEHKAKLAEYEQILKQYELDKVELEAFRKEREHKEKEIQAKRKAILETLDDDLKKIYTNATLEQLEHISSLVNAKKEGATVMQPPAKTPPTEVKTEREPTPRELELLKLASMK